MFGMAPEEVLGTPVTRIVRHHFCLRSPSAGDNSPTAAFHQVIRSSVVDVVRTPSLNRSTYTTPPLLMEQPAALSRNKRIRPLGSPPPNWGRLTMAVPALRREESAGREGDQQGAPAAESSAAEVTIDLMVEPEEQEAELEPEPRQTPLLEFWRRRDRGGPAV